MSLPEGNYGRWSGNPRGMPENVFRCIEEVPDTQGWIPHQCQRRRGFGEDGLFCKQHAARNAERIAAREA